MKNYEIDETALFVLSTGENILGVVKKVNNSIGLIVLDNPVYIFPEAPTEENPQGGLSSIAYLSYSEETDVEFESKDVRHYLTPKADIADWYNQIIGRKVIITPPEQKIITK